MVAQVCFICDGAHGYTKCPEPLRIPSTPQKAGEDARAYESRLRKNAYIAKWMREHPQVQRRRKAVMKKARANGGPLHENEKARNRRRNARRADLLARIKAAPCMDCGGSFPPCVMDFDHREPGTKDARYASPGNMARAVPLAEFLAEIEKCDLVCANCHRIRTHQRRATLART